jgi:hypothetical protein
MQYYIVDLIHSLLTYNRWYQHKILSPKLEEVVAGIKSKAAECICCLVRFIVLLLVAWFIALLSSHAKLQLIVRTRKKNVGPDVKT